MDRNQPAAAEVAGRNTLSLLLRAISYLKPYTRLTVGVYLVMLAINGISLLTPQFMRWIIDNGIYRNDLRLLGLSALGLVALTMIKSVLGFLEGTWSEEMSQGAAYDLRNQIQRKLNRLSFAYHDKTQSGQMLSRAMEDVERIRFLTGRAILRIVEGAILILGTAILLIATNAGLGVLVVSILPIYIWRAWAFNDRYRPLAIKIQDQLGVLTSRVEQNLRGSLVVKVFCQERAEADSFNLENDRWFDLTARSTRLEAVNVPLLGMIANLGTVLILLWGGYLVTTARLTPGELVAFTAYLGQLIQPMTRVGRIVPRMSISASAAERIFEVLDSEVQVQASPLAVSLPRLRGHVRFEHVWFTYDEGYPILQDVCFSVQPGQMVALLGATGSGKSTIINLLARFYDPTEGRILIDDLDLRELDLAFIRRQIGMVFQDSRLFATTIRENIAFGRPEASEQEILAAAMNAQVMEFVRELPAGLDTVVGERGTTLSGGQKQRVSIARALLTDPRILVLDDATSSVDSHTEGLIQQALDRLVRDRTSFIIAHRLSTVHRADTILLLEKGRIIAQGDHPTLLAQSPQYARICELHLSPQEATARRGPA